MKAAVVLILSVIILSNCFAQLSGTQFKDALVSKNADLHYVFSDAPGFSVIKNGRITGICVDIMKDFEFFLLDKYGIQVNSVIHNEYLYDLPAFFNVISNAKYGVFGLSNITHTKEREQYFQFSPSFIKNYAVMLSHNSVADLPLIDSIQSSFSGLRAVSVVGSTNMDQLLEIKKAYYPEMRIDCVKSFKEVIEVLVLNENYFTLIDLAYWVQARDNYLPIKEHLAGVQKAENLAVIMPYETDWNIPLRKFLTNDYKNSLSYRKIINRHLGWEALSWLDQMQIMESIINEY